MAFVFSRSEAATYRDAAGTEQAAAIDAPRFDHDEAGAPRGLLATPGSDIGTQDRLAVDPLMLPELLLTGDLPGQRDATVFHAFVPLGSETVQRRAYYTRTVRETIDGLLAQAGHHVEIGVITGFRANLGGYARLRGQVWTIAGILAGNGAGAALAVDPEGALPLIVAGATPHG